MASILTANDVTFGESCVRSKAGIVPQISVFTSPGTFNAQPSTTRIKVTIVGGGTSTPGTYC